MITCSTIVKNLKPRPFYRVRRKIRCLDAKCGYIICPLTDADGVPYYKARCLGKQGFVVTGRFVPLLPEGLNATLQALGPIDCNRIHFVLERDNCFQTA